MMGFVYFQNNSVGPVQFFAVDNINLTEAELLWLDQELSKSQARWKLIYGHYHIYSATRGDNKELIEKLLPILEKNHVEIYLNGHDHRRRKRVQNGNGSERQCDQTRHPNLDG